MSPPAAASPAPNMAFAAGLGLRIVAIVAALVPVAALLAIGLR